MTRAADDFQSIGRVLADLEAKRPAAIRCQSCQDTGYKFGTSEIHPAYPVWVECQACGNPAGKPRP